MIVSSWPYKKSAVIKRILLSLVHLIISVCDRPQNCLTDFCVRTSFFAASSTHKLAASFPDTWESIFLYTHSSFYFPPSLCKVASKSVHWQAGADDVLFVPTDSLYVLSSAHED